MHLKAQRLNAALTEAERKGKLSNVVAIPGKRQFVWKLPLQTLEEVDRFNREINSATCDKRARLIAASENNTFPLMFKKEHHITFIDKLHDDITKIYCWNEILLNIVIFTKMSERKRNTFTPKLKSNRKSQSSASRNSFCAIKNVKISSYFFHFKLEECNSGTKASAKLRILLQ